MSEGPLGGLRVIEMAGIGPGPFVGMLLADMGAEVIVVERPAALRSLGAGEAMNRGKRSICLDLKHPLGLQAVKKLIAGADALIEGYRPGVMERLGLGPADCEAGNPRLVYGRVTGWGQTGPLAQAAGHDINYVALTGALSIATREGVAPSLPATLLGDMAGGAMFAAFGIVCALLEARASGRGQVVDAAMVDGVGALTALVHSLRASGFWREQPAQNFFLHSSPFYDSFKCADGRYVTLGAIEPQFYRELLQRLELHDLDPAQQYDARQWPALRERVAARIRTKTRAEWTALLEGSDVCFAPVLSLDEAARHPHNQARGNFVEVDGHWQPAAAPRFSRSAIRAPQRGPAPGADGRTLLGELGFDAQQIAALLPSEG
ncbi:CaiB/BaiF CoA transferase family protein [Roseateles violae]|uniref:CaiB/BaiF CoA-transferase family protein n=1 Tax=Roseateles violae TaxID=3058042 RepID=A0ABT8E019_9BURK|nr:CaiB/BaiF CoA-transferase family protein [Pelomonas sp. PFR6]MDN3923140.1 CaiB/BaiF CoA-transferase family protein [Pelomonas sp. PFR6]